MIPRPPSPSRPDLGFEQAARSAFAFLTVEYGMQVTDSQPTFVRYENDAFFVNIYHGRSSYELAFEVGRKDGSGDEEAPFRLGAFLYLTDPSAVESFRYFVAMTREEVEHGLSDLAARFRATAVEFLSRPELIERLKSNRKKVISEFAEEIHDYHARPKAEEAFRQRDYKTAAVLYGSMGSRLTPVEQTKLKIARNRGR